MNMCMREKCGEIHKWSIIGRRFEPENCKTKAMAVPGNGEGGWKKTWADVVRINGNV